jgi:hypothetical protein
VSQLAAGEVRSCPGAQCIVTLRLPTPASAPVDDSGGGRGWLVLLLVAGGVTGLLVVGWTTGAIQATVGAAWDWLWGLLSPVLRFLVICMLLALVWQWFFERPPQVQCRGTTTRNQQCRKDGLRQYGWYCATHKWDGRDAGAW